MARSYDAEELQMYFDILRTEEYVEEIICWTHSADPKMRCRYLFPLPRFGITTWNPVEILFRALGNCWHYHALDLLLQLETYILSKRFEQWNKSQQMKNVINDSTIAKVNQQSAEAVCYHVQQTGLSKAVICTTGTSARYAVDISINECSCVFYQEELIPRRHAIKLLTSIGRDPKDYCSDIILLNIWGDVCRRSWSFTCNCNQRSSYWPINTSYSRNRIDHNKILWQSAENQVCNLPIL